MASNPFSGFHAVDGGRGSSYYIGDGIVITAGHVAYEAAWNWLKRAAKRACRFGVTSALALGLSACSFGGSTGQADWKEQSIFVQVGEVIYELEPGYTYALANMKDEEINTALSNGEGVRSSPLVVSSIRIGAREEEDQRNLDYDVSIAKLSAEGARVTVAIPDPVTSLSSVHFTQSPDGLSGNTYEGSATFRFSSGQLIERSVRCSVVLIGEEIRNVFCSTSGLEHRGNRIALRARGGSAANVASDFENGLKLISQIEWN